MFSLFNMYAENIYGEDVDESSGVIKINKKIINRVRYANNTL